MIENSKLSKLIKYAENFPINDLPGFTNIMSLDSKYIRVSDNALKLIGDKSQDNLFCTTYENMPCKASESTETFQQEDQAALKNDIKILSYSNFDEWKVLLGHKKPIIQDNEMIGTIANFIDVTNSGIIDIGKFLLTKSRKTIQKQASFIIQGLPDYHGLSKREQDCLFFLIRGCGYAEISRRLCVAITTVQTHMEHIKEKFKVNNKSQVIEKAISLGFMCIIPENLLKMI